MTERYSLSLTLRGVDPPITRQLEIPVFYSAYELHLAVQVCYWWNDLSDFELVEGTLTVGTAPSYAGAGLTHGGRRYRHADEVTVGDLFAATGDRVEYTYDFDKRWTVALVLRGRSYADSELPSCTTGERAAPPEDVGGAGGYEALLFALADATHPAHVLAEETLGAHFESELFNPRSVDEALAELFGEAEEEDDDEADSWSSWNPAAYDDKARIEDLKYEVDQRLPSLNELKGLSAGQRAAALAQAIKGL